MSNFYACPNGIVYEGLLYPSVEHAYQAAKVPKSDRHEFINKTAGQVKKLGKKVSLPQNWGQIKFEIMKELISLKFQDPEFRKLLKETGSKHLEERNSWGDRYWGTDEQGVGENNLGKIEMEERLKI